MRMIPGKTKVNIELFKKVTIADILLGIFSVILLSYIFTSTIPYKLYIGLGILLILIFLFARINEEANYLYVLHIIRHFGYRRKFARKAADEGFLAKKNAENTPETGSAASESEASSRFLSAETNLEEGGNALTEVGTEELQATFAKVKGEVTEGAEEDDGSAAEWSKKAADTVQDKKQTQAKSSKKALLKKKQKALYAAESKKLKTGTLTEVERQEIYAARKARAAEIAQVAAEAKDKATKRQSIKQIVGFTGIRNGMIEYDKKYYGAVIEIPPVEFRFFSAGRRKNSIEQGIGKILRGLTADLSVNIVKLERPIIYDRYLEREQGKLQEVKNAYENGLLNELELMSRSEVIFDRIYGLRSLCYEKKVISPAYYLVLYDADPRQLTLQVATAMDSLRDGEMDPHNLDDKELAVFLRYSNELDFNEREIEEIDPKDYVNWAMPRVVDITPRRVEVNHIITHNFRVINYPVIVGDAWLASVFSMPATKCVIKCKPMDRTKAVRAIDRSLEELRDQYRSTSVDSKQLELQTHIETLNELLSVLQQDNETLLLVNIYVTAYDMQATRNNLNMVQPGESDLYHVSNMKKSIRRLYQENGIRLSGMEFDQTQAFIGSQINAWDPMHQDGRGIPTNTIAAAYPWIFSTTSDEGGIHMGYSDGVPVFIDFFRRDSERLNSNVVIVGKSGSGKSFATKSLLTNLAADDSKIFVLDPENEVRHEVA